MWTVYTHKIPTMVQVNYHPSKQYDIDDNAASKSHGTAWTSPAASGPRVKQGIEKENNFQQPGEYYRSFDRDSKDVFQKHLLTFMTHPKCSEAVQKTWIGFMHKVGWTCLLTQSCLSAVIVVLLLGLIGCTLCMEHAACKQFEDGWITEGTLSVAPCQLQVQYTAALFSVLYQTIRCKHSLNPVVCIADRR